MIRLTAISALILLVVGCSGLRRPAEEQPPSVGVWEIAWVDPQIVVSTDLLTVIRAERIDSILVAPDNYFPPTSPEVSFALVATDCRVAANILDGHGRVVMPLLVQLLGPGHYKLTVNKIVLVEQGLPVGRYMLAASVCGDRQIAEFTIP
ncbi:hypothetical protein KQH82_10865 [bacterium]|nr:hypothetical protein [bacterium]